MITAMSSSDSAVPRFTFRRLCVSEAETTSSSSLNPAASARRAPPRLGTSAEYRTDGALVMSCHTWSASAICGIASGWTKDTASIREIPVRDSVLISSTLAAVGTGSSFCRPSRGPTSRSEMRAGRSLTGGSLSRPPALSRPPCGLPPATVTLPATEVTASR